MLEEMGDILSYFTNRIQAAKEQRLTELDLSVPYGTKENDKLDRIPEAVFELTQLEKLNLSNNHIKEIPETINNLTSLTHLNLSGNRLKEIPKEITNLTSLTHLNLGGGSSFYIYITGNSILDIPKVIANLINLVQLDLSGNLLEEIPKEITNLTSLTYLNLSGNRLKEIPKEITNLTSLTHLYLSENSIVEIPKEITNLTSLTYLNLSGNHLKEIPKSITNLTSLTHLYLSGNNIENFPETITNLISLTHLYLRKNSLFELNMNGNDIKEIPKKITNLTKLTHLDVSGNGIKEIPKAITQLTHLTYLNLSKNGIKEIPKAITQLTNLTQLDLNENGIEEIPEAITQLTNLTQLDLSRNGIKEIPKAITQLTNLTQLDLNENGIKEIPEAITQLTNLTHLYLSGNGIKEIPKTITNLTSLTSLNLYDNNIREIPEAITQLTSLIQLSLVRNWITEIPKAITQLTSLTYLYLSENGIVEIPKSITNLTSLIDLNLAFNSIVEIPETITQLTNLIILDLDSNEIENPPLEVTELGIKSIRDYFRQLKTGEDYIYEAKLIIVGEGGAGKTTLAKKIENPDYQLQPNEPTTEGIDVIEWSFPILDRDNQEREFKVNIWDFGGQEIYHTTHQFFLTKRSLYALVADTRKEDTDFYYWLNVVELLTDNSPILIVKNEKQDRHREIDERRLRKEFLNLKETLPTNLATKRGLPEILERIKLYIKELPHVGTTLPKTWVEVRKALEENPHNYISLEKYLAICTEHGFAKYQDALQLSQYLHDLGVCLHFQDDPVLNNIVILKPEWGTDAVYKVLDNNTVVRNLGCFNKQDLAKIWGDAKYQRMHNSLLQLMIKFKLCYEIPNKKGNYIAPQLLSLNSPEYNWNQTENLRLCYSYEFMPKGILTRFIVEMHKSIHENIVWRNGVVLSNDYAKAEVIQDYEKKEIYIKINGNNKRDLMTIVTNEIDKINNSYERIKVNKLIPCNCDSCQPIQNPYYFPFQQLLERYSFGKYTIECGKPPYHEVRVLDLIDNAIDLKKLVSHNKEIRNKSINFNGEIQQLVFQLLEQGNVKGDLKMSDRNINIKRGNYNEKIEGDYIQGNKIDRSYTDKSDRSNKIEVGGDFSANNSPMMSENVTTNNTITNPSPQPATDKKRINWNLLAIIVAVIAIFSGISLSGVFNDEFRKFFNLDSSPETTETVEPTPIE